MMVNALPQFTTISFKSDHRRLMKGDQSTDVWSHGQYTISKNLR